jgi:hypothetical protein
MGVTSFSVSSVTMRHPVADARRHECSAGSQYPTAGRPTSHGVTLTTLTPCSMLFRTTHRPQTSWVSPPDAVASPRRRHRPSPEVPRFVTLTRTQLAASRAAGQAVCPSTVISKAGPPLCGVGPDCGLVPQAASAIAAIIQIRASWRKKRKLCSLQWYIRMAGNAGVPFHTDPGWQKQSGAQSQTVASGGKRHRRAACGGPIGGPRRRHVIRGRSSWSRRPPVGRGT